VPHDLLVTGGTLIDVGAGRRGRFDVGVRAGRVAEVAPQITPDGAEVVDVTGLLLTPGLIDLHTHVHPGATYWGIDPDPIAWYTGVTTWVDAGSAGAFTLDALRATIDTRRVRVPVLLNISAVGLTGAVGECRDLDACDPDLAAATIHTNRDLVAGIKVRIDRYSVGGNGLEPLRRAIEVGTACELPVMVHVGAGPPTLDDVLALLRPGDIVTHCASGIAAGANPDGVLVSPALVAAHAAGVRFDLGHGSGGFAFDVLAAQLEAGLEPFTVSTDLHARSLFGPVFDLPTTMTKLLALGLPLEQVVGAATVQPALALGLPDGLGTLAVGAPADLAVFELQEGRFEVSDCHRQVRQTGRRLVNRATYLAGRLLPARLPPPPPPWVPLTDRQREALRVRERTVRDLLTAPLVDADGLAEQFPRPATG
jgi:dihydroorotase